MRESELGAVFGQLKKDTHLQRNSEGEGQEEGRTSKRKITPNKLYKMLLSLRLPKARKRSWNS